MLGIISAGRHERMNRLWRSTQSRSATKSLLMRLVVSEGRIAKQLQRRETPISLKYKVSGSRFNGDRKLCGICLTRSRHVTGEVYERLSTIVEKTIDSFPVTGR